MKKLLLILVVTVVTLCGCQKSAETYSISFRSKSGIILATGTVRLKAPLPASGRIDASYQIKLIASASTEQEAENLNRALRDRTEGTVVWNIQPDQPKWHYTFSFTPGHPELDIVASTPQLTQNLVKGEWRYALGTGSRLGGVFELEKK